jgi:Fic family protein
MLFNTPDLGKAELAVIAATDRLREDLNYAARTPLRWYGLLRRSTFARAIRGSNAIEGYKITVDDAMAVVEGEEPIDPKDETWMAVNGYRMAMTFVLQKAEDQFFSFSAELFKALHFMMVGYSLNKNPGRWRPGPIYVRDEKTGEQVYEGPPQEKVQDLVDELLLALNAADGTPSLVRAAMAHLNLVMIHPFSDGNGRMGRSLQTLVLARTGVTAPLFSSIEEYLGRNTLDYYNILAEVGGGAWHPEHDASPWIRFCLTAHYRQAMTLLRRRREIQKICDQIESILRRLRLPERGVLALADAALGYRVRNATYRNAADVSDAVAGSDLRALVKANLLEAHGEKRGRFYLASPSIMEIRVKVAEPKPVADPFKDNVILEGSAQGNLFPT